MKTEEFDFYVHTFAFDVRAHMLNSEDFSTKELKKSCEL